MGDPPGLEDDGPTREPTGPPVRRRAPAMALGLLVAAATVSPVGASEDGPWDRYGALLVRGVNTDQSEERAVVVVELFSVAALAERGAEALAGLLERLHGDFAPLEFHHAEVAAFERPEGTRRVLHVFARRPGAVLWQDFQLRLAVEPPHRVDSLGFIAEVTEPVHLPSGSVESIETLAWLGRYIDKLESETGLSGSLALVGPRGVLLERTFGYADADRTRPVTIGTRFNVASGGKMFTALAALRLVEEGVLSLREPVVEHVPALSSAGFGRDLEVRHLLAHASGIPEYWRPSTEDAVAAAIDNAGHLAVALGVIAEGPQFAPGERFAYSNTNYVLLGAILARVTGRPYEEIVAERVFEPAGMEDTGFAPTPVAAEPQRRGAGGRWERVTTGTGGSAAGGVTTTVGDVLAFRRALLSGRLVSEETLADMVERHSPPGGSLDYGYGFVLQRSADGVPSFGHGGIADGVNFEFRIFPTRGVGLVLFSNQDNGAYDDLKRNTIRLITGER